MLYAPWCERNVDEENSKQLWQLTELAGGRAAVEAVLTARIRSHYDNLDQIAEDVRLLGYPDAATILSERMPRSARARSGELGEILATELAEEYLEFNIPVRRLRYKDGREMALRGDDFVGVRLDAEANLHFLKGESKSRAKLTKTTISEAREALSRDDGRPTATSLLFVADRLMEGEGECCEIGRKIRNEVARRAAPPSQTSHMLFTMSGNATHRAQIDDLAAADGGHPHFSAHLCIEDHQAFISTCYEKALALGND
jgi:hypothetical protein